MGKVFFCLTVALCLAASGFAQNLVSFNRTGTMTVSQTNQMIAAF